MSASTTPLFQPLSLALLRLAQDSGSTPLPTAGGPCEYRVPATEDGGVEAICVGGRLWDAGALIDPAAALDGGELPCPCCNTEGWLQTQRDQVIDEGWTAAVAGDEPLSCPYRTCALPAEAAREALVRWWLEGFQEGQPGLAA